MHTLRSAAPPLLAALVAGCSTLRADADWDGEIDFSKFRTFALVERPAEPHDPTEANPMVQRWIRERIGAVLSAGGYQSAAADGADLHVSFAVGEEQKVRVYAAPGTRTGYAYPHRPGRWRTRSPDITAHRYTEGTLVIDLVDASTGELVWHGWAHDTLDPSWTTEERERKVEEAVAAILARFPPPQP